MAPTTLRPYQEKFIEAIRTNLAQYKRIIACAATGSGKSKIFIRIAQMAHAKGLTVLVLTESSKIYEQLTGELQAGNINASRKDGAILPGHIYIAMAQTLARRPHMLRQFTEHGPRLLIITDEAHIGTPTKLLLQLPAAFHIGFTATPDWRSAKHLPLLYNACIVGPQPDELVTEGYLSPYLHFARVLADLDELKIKSGEFTEESQELIFESRKVYDGLLTDLKQMTYKKAIIFTASIKHCTDVHTKLTAAGFNAIQVHSGIPSNSQSLNMARYRSPDTGIDICVSVGILTKGWDFPAVDLVILNRATTSLPLYLQMIGRGSRISDNKPSFTVLDYGGNYERHGLWDANIDWQKKWKEQPKKKKDGVAPIKMCPKCDFINPVSVMVCKNCGHKFAPPEPTEDDIEKTKLIELTAKYRQLVGKRISELKPHELALYAKFKNKKAYAARVAKSKEQAGLTGFLSDFAACMNYAKGWTFYQQKELTAPIAFHDILIK